MLISNTVMEANSTRYINTSASDRSYTFTPLTSQTKLTLTAIIYLVGVIATIGNIGIIAFRHALNNRRLQRNRTFYFVQSLAWSDLGASVLSLPLYNAIMLVDVVKNDYICKAVRAVNIAFPVITIQNLLVIALERYVAIFHPFFMPSIKTVKRLVLMAWAYGIVGSIIISATYNLIPVNIDNDKYTLVCLYDNSIPAYKFMFYGFVIFVYIIPSAILVFIVIRMTRYFRKGRVSIENCNSADKLRLTGSRMFLDILIAFIIPYLLWFAYTIANFTFKPKLSFETEFILRYAIVTLAYANGAINPAIYVYHTKELREILRMIFHLRVNQISTGNIELKEVRFKPKKNLPNSHPSDNTQL
ncbi:predicted protein [Nematostella vectensis]|uniref:G-protein coupled receptors family 1 profile domain-containing protein n=1 Tax=Nematostella vectensis TaxID=45351 RepID=A7RZ39_NEMVE|nr:galanin receptor 2a [Nematostella vectensis]EDO43341.1 predicted protein [Nematostella vectensis]|eukprot:XP_001635404.1 predicted protein [Nematostella vectensis]